MRIHLAEIGMACLMLLKKSELRILGWGRIFARRKTKAESMHLKTPYPWFRTLRLSFSYCLLLMLPLQAGIPQLRGADIVVAANSTTAANGTISAPSSSEQPPVAAPPQKSSASSDQEITRTLLKELLDAPDRSIVKKIKFQEGVTSLVERTYGKLGEMAKIPIPRSQDSSLSSPCSGASPPSSARSRGRACSSA